MNRLFSLVSDDYPEISLSSIGWDDQKKMRLWKNDSRRSFFYQKIIKPDDQKEWFEDYLSRNQDFVFLIKNNKDSIGCIGFRLQEMQWDIYNVMLGNTSFRGKGYMRKALRMVCSYAVSLKPLPVTAKVLTANPALQWYYRNGFEQKTVQSGYVQVELSVASFTPCNLREINRFDAAENKSKTS